MYYGNFILKHQIPIKLIFYEDLKESPKTEMQKVLNFLKKNFNFEPDDAKHRMYCLGMGLYF